MTTLKQLEEFMSNDSENWYDHPERIQEANDVGDLYVQWFLDNYVGGRLDKNMDLFNRAFALLTERGHYSRDNAFGEMHGDCYLWIEKCEHSQVLVYEQQSSRILFIKENLYDETYGEDKPMFGKFHIREIWYKYAYPSWKKAQLKGYKLKDWRKADFKPSYGDARDIGYVATAEHNTLRGYETSIKDATMRASAIIDLMGFWEVYLDNPEDLE